MWLLSSGIIKSSNWTPPLQRKKQSRIIKCLVKVFSYFSPKLLATAAEQFKYKIPYGEYFGGVVALSWDNFQVINGFTNR